MCGIAMISPAPGNPLPVRVLTRWLLTDLSSRGRDAAGVAWKRPDGTVLYRKVAGHPVRLSAKLAAVSGSRSLDDSGAVIVHTRHATQGPASQSRNNHPIIRPGVAMVHNGHVRNTRALYRAARAQQMAEVDSDALAALIETAKTMDAVLARFAKIEGLAALAWLEVTDDPADAGAGWLARLDTRPLAIGEIRGGGLVAASTDSILRRSCQSAEVELTDIMHLSEGDVVKVDQGEIVAWHEARTGSGQAESIAEYVARG